MYQWIINFSSDVLVKWPKIKMKNIKKINLLFLTFVISNNYVFFNNNRIQYLRNYGKFYMQK